MAQEGYYPGNRIGNEKCFGRMMGCKDCINPTESYAYNTKDRNTHCNKGSTKTSYCSCCNFHKSAKEISKLVGVRIQGIMAIPPICEDEQILRGYFKKMSKLFVDIGNEKIDNSSMKILSMGMSDDFAVAIEEGANLVRIGTALFGRRNYNI